MESVVGKSKCSACSECSEYVVYGHALTVHSLRPSCAGARVRVRVSEVCRCTICVLAVQADGAMCLHVCHAAPCYS